MRTLHCLPLLLLAASRAPALEVRPDPPTICAPVVLLVTRAFSEDCGWRAIVATTTDPSGSIELRLTPQRGGAICLQVAREITFQIPLGVLEAGNYQVTARWSDLPDLPADELAFKVSEAECLDFQRGDANADGTQNLSDAVAVLAYLFLGGPIACIDAADTDSTERVSLTDAVFLLNHLFLGGPPPDAPFPGCGKLPEGSTTLGCEKSACEGGGGEPVWMEKPDGCVQCEECTAPGIDEVVEALETGGIPVLESGTGQLAACEACHVCPSGRVYRVRVARRDAAALEAMGWSEALVP